MVVYSYFLQDPRPKREAEALRRRGMEVDVICLRREPSLPLRERVDGINLVRVPLARRREGKRKYIIQYTQFFFAALAVLSVRHLRRRYDLVHVHNMPDFLVFSAVLPRLTGAKILLDLHDPVPELFQSIYRLKGEGLVVRCLKKVERLSIGFADRVLTPNVAFAELFASRSCAREKIEIVMNSPGTTVFGEQQPVAAANGASKGTYELIYHGLMAERQGVDLVVQAVHHLRSRIPGLRLHLYGEPTPYSNQVMQLVRELNLEKKVIYHGFKVPHEVPGAIAAAELGLVPNRLNPFTSVNLPTRIFEYLALGRMAIVPRTGGILDYFKEDELIFFEPGNVADLARKIEWAYFHPLEVQAILERGRRIYQRHRWEGEEGKFVNVVGELLEGGQGGGVRGEAG